MKYFKEMYVNKLVVIFSVLLSFLSGNCMTLVFTNVIAYCTTYYYNRGKQLPPHVRRCLYKVYKDKEFVDNLRYVIDSDIVPIDPLGLDGRCFGNLLVFSSKESFEEMQLVVHEVCHSQQIRKMGKIKFMVVLLWQWVWTRGYNNIPIEIETKYFEELSHDYCTSKK